MSASVCISVNVRARVLMNVSEHEHKLIFVGCRNLIITYFLWQTNLSCLTLTSNIIVIILDINHKGLSYEKVRDELRVGKVKVEDSI